MAFPHQNQIKIATFGLNVLPWLLIFGGLLGLFPRQFISLSMLLVVFFGLLAIIIGIRYERRRSGEIFDVGAFACILIGCVNLGLGVFTVPLALSGFRLSDWIPWLP